MACDVPIGIVRSKFGAIKWELIGDEGEKDRRSLAWGFGKPGLASTASVATCPERTGWVTHNGRPSAASEALQDDPSSVLRHCLLEAFPTYIYLFSANELIKEAKMEQNWPLSLFG